MTGEIIGMTEREEFHNLEIWARNVCTGRKAFPLTQCMVTLGIHYAEH